MFTWRLCVSCVVRTKTLFFVSQDQNRSFLLIALKGMVDWILTNPLILFLFACTINPEKYCFIEASVGGMSIAFVTGFWFGFSQLRIYMLGRAAKRTVAKRLKYREMSFVRSC